jgi:hypothetical protein
VTRPLHALGALALQSSLVDVVGVLLLVAAGVAALAAPAVVLEDLLGVDRFRATAASAALWALLTLFFVLNTDLDVELSLLLYRLTGVGVPLPMTYAGTSFTVIYGLLTVGEYLRQR